MQKEGGDKVVKLTRVYNRIMIFFVILGAVALVVMTLTTIVDVILRSAVAQGVRGSDEIVSYMLTLVVYFGAGYCALHKGLIVVELFKVPRIIKIINDILCVIVGGIIIYYALVQAMFSMQSGMGSLLLSIPKWPFMIATAIGYLTMSGALIINIINDEISRKKGIYLSTMESNLEDATRSVDSALASNAKKGGE